MPTFVCQSIGPDGALVEGRVIAGTRASAFDQLRARGHLPVSVAESGEERASFKFLTLDRGKIADKQLLAITKELSLLLGAGQQLEQALALIVKSAPSARVRRALSDIRDRIRSGASFADALESTGQFPSLYIAMVRAGEVRRNAGTGYRAQWHTSRQSRANAGNHHIRTALSDYSGHGRDPLRWPDVEICRASVRCLVRRNGSQLALDHAAGAVALEMGQAIWSDRAGQSFSARYLCCHG